MLLSLPVLEALLRGFEIPIEQWGKGEAVPVHNLLGEVVGGESSLLIENGELVRRVRVVKMIITREGNPKRTLLEWGQHLPPPRSVYREVKQNPSGKIKKTDKDAKAAVLREAWEELGITQSDLHVFSAREAQWESRPSTSHPGLASLYHVHAFDMMLGYDVVVCHRPEFIRVDQADLVRHVFKWVDE